MSDGSEKWRSFSEVVLRFPGTIGSKQLLVLVSLKYHVRKKSAVKNIYDAILS